MTFQYGVALRTAKQQAIITYLGVTPTLKIFSGAEPGNCAAGDPSGLLCTISLPNPPFTAASGALTLAGSWTTSTSTAGTAASFRIYDTAGPTCCMQGNVTTDLVLNNTSIGTNQTVTVTAFGDTAGNT